MDKTIWIALIGLAGTLLTVAATVVLGVRAQRAERRTKTAEAQKEAAEREAEAERDEKERMDKRWNDLVDAKDTEMDRLRADRDRYQELWQQALSKRRP